MSSLFDLSLTMKVGKTISGKVKSTLILLGAPLQSRLLWSQCSFEAHSTSCQVELRWSCRQKRKSFLAFLLGAALDSACYLPCLVGIPSARG